MKCPPSLVGISFECPVPRPNRPIRALVSPTDIPGIGEVGGKRAKALTALLSRWLPNVNFHRIFHNGRVLDPAVLG